MATANTTKHQQSTDNSDSVAALRFLSAVAGQMEGVTLTNEEAYGMEVVLKGIAEKIEGSNA